MQSAGIDWTLWHFSLHYSTTETTVFTRMSVTVLPCNIVLHCSRSTMWLKQNIHVRTHLTIWLFCILVIMPTTSELIKFNSLRQITKLNVGWFAGLSLIYTIYSIQSHRTDQNRLTKYVPPASSLLNIHIFRASVQQYKFGLPPPVWPCCPHVFVPVLVSMMKWWDTTSFCIAHFKGKNIYIYIYIPFF